MSLAVSLALSWGGHWISRLRGAVFVLVPTMLLIDPGTGAGKKEKKKKKKKKKEEEEENTFQTLDPEVEGNQ